MDLKLEGLCDHILSREREKYEMQLRSEEWLGNRVTLRTESVVSMVVNEGGRQQVRNRGRSTMKYCH